MKKVIWLMIAGLILGVIACILFISRAPRVVFEDVEMGNVIAFELSWHGEKRNRGSITQDELVEIKELNIGYTGYYTTLIDVEKCSMLEALYIGAPLAGNNYYEISRDIPKTESTEKILQIENELAGILKNCTELKVLYVWNTKGTCALKSLEFLENADGLELLGLDEQGAIDYFPVWGCKSLTTLSLYGCDISDVGGISNLENLTHLDLKQTDIEEAGDILNLAKLEVLYIEDTPLAENEEELALIYETFPDIKLYK